jgi:hypothetical protein
MTESCTEKPTPLLSYVSTAPAVVVIKTVKDEMEVLVERGVENA